MIFRLLCESKARSRICSTSLVHSALLIISLNFNSVFFFKFGANFKYKDRSKILSFCNLRYHTCVQEAHLRMFMKILIWIHNYYIYRASCQASRALYQPPNFKPNYTNTNQTRSFFKPCSSYTGRALLAAYIHHRYTHFKFAKECDVLAQNTFGIQHLLAPFVQKSNSEVNSFDVVVFFSFL